MSNKSPLPSSSVNTEMTKSLLKVPEVQVQATIGLLLYSFRYGKIKAKKEVNQTETPKGQSVKDNEGLRNERFSRRNGDVAQILYEL